MLFTTNSQLPAKVEEPQPAHITAVSLIVGAIGIMYYLNMYKKETAAHKAQESFINQLILEQDITPELRENLRTIIQRYSIAIESYSNKKNLGVFPLLVGAAGLGYAASRSFSSPSGN
jgi:hypothetical protein